MVDTSENSDKPESIKKDPVEGFFHAPKRKEASLSITRAANRKYGLFKGEETPSIPPVSLVDSPDIAPASPA
jgi:hypothetical protein